MKYYAIKIKLFYCEFVKMKFCNLQSLRDCCLNCVAELCMAVGSIADNCTENHINNFFAKIIFFVKYFGLNMRTYNYQRKICICGGTSFNSVLNPNTSF